MDLMDGSHSTRIPGTALAMDTDLLEARVTSDSARHDDFKGVLLRSYSLFGLGKTTLKGTAVAGEGTNSSCDKIRPSSIDARHSGLPR